jgi:branched-chain amino acid transport system ATP-binding protein
MGRPQLLLLDEPSMGLAPRVVTEIFACIAALKAGGITLLLVDQNARAALRVADRGYVLETGNIVLEGSGADLLRNPQVQEAYLGV